jgi:hypothetical protein
MMVMNPDEFLPLFIEKGWSVTASFDDAENREKARKLKSMVFLTKPADDQVLIDTIKWVLHSAQENICMLR